jgi:hypothetical protein
MRKRIGRLLDTAGRFVYEAIEKLFAGCRRGLGFNLLCREPAGGGPPTTRRISWPFAKRWRLKWCW